MLQIIWEYRVAAPERERFEAFYGPKGEWAELFARSADFTGTLLLRDPSVIGRYITIDTWKHAEAFDRFQEHSRLDYQALDRASEALTEYEMKIGSFEVV